MDEDVEALRPKGLLGGQCGDFVAVRPLDDEKTHLGVYLGEIARGFTTSYDKSDQSLTVAFAYHNPAIFVPDLNRVVMGCESWWGKIEGPGHLRAITDGDIENVWYVKALKAMSEDDPDRAGRG